MLSRFHLIPERHGQTDGQTDRIAISISRVSTLTRDKKTRRRGGVLLQGPITSYSQFHLVKRSSQMHQNCNAREKSCTAGFFIAEVIQLCCVAVLLQLCELL